jgi:hypothetical protein
MEKEAHDAAAGLEHVASRILVVRGKRVLLDRDLAALYRVPAKVLNQAVNRNKERFPGDFMFELSWQETEALSRSQFVTLKQGDNPKYRPHVFTEQGVAMLSSVLRSRRASEVNIAIMRAFVRLREIAATNSDFALRLDALERQLLEHDAQLKGVFDAIRELMDPDAGDVGREKIGFRVPGPANRKS